MSGIKILIESDRRIVESEEFLPFLIKECTPDIHIIIRMSEDMPDVPEKPIYSDIFCAIGKNEEGHLQKYFFGNSHEQDGYVVSTYNPDEKHILIEYPESYSCVELQLRSCFYWLGFEAYLLNRDKLCLHASCVDTHLGGILFSGVSGIGKSTQAELWCRYRKVRQINGDRPILSKENGGWKAWGSPYAGSSKYYVNDSCDISAIILLKQAKSCSLRRLTLPEAFRGVWSGLTIRSWDASFVDAASLLTIELVTSVPVYEFCCTADEQAVDYLEAELGKENSL